MQKASPSEPATGIDDDVIVPPAVGEKDRLATPAPAEVEAAQTRRRHWLALLAVLVVVVFAAAAGGWSLTRPTVAGARVDFILEPGPDLSDAAVEREIATQLLIAHSPSVLEPVATSVDRPLAAVTDAVSVGMVGGSNVLRITVADLDKTTAVSLATTVAREYQRAIGRIPAVGDQPRPMQVIVLTPAELMSEPLAPRPLRALAAGGLVGLFVAAGLLLLLARPTSTRRDSS